MDKFVTVTKKSKTGDDITESPNDKNGAQSIASTSQKSVDSKQKSAKRKFNIEWENEYFVTENNGKTIWCAE